MNVEIRVGITDWGVAKRANPHPWLMSANRLYNHKRGEFRDVHRYARSGVALDSAGFVAMKLHGGYPWSVEDYVRVGALEPWDWWASMDYCCEPEVAGNRGEVLRRVRATADKLAELRCHVHDWRDEGAEWATMPMPVIQGWSADDYRRSVDLTDKALGGEWPAMVGIGSVCRRRLRGHDGVLRVFGAVAAAVPQTTRLHLFGVKSGALAHLATHPQMGSIDSCAYDMAARWESCKGGFPNSIAHRVKHLHRWVDQQVNILRDAQEPPRQGSLL